MNEIEFLLRLHQQLCDLADTILYYHDACGFEARGGSKSYRITDCHGGTMPSKCCSRTRFHRADGDPLCQFMGDYGCKNENIECKLYLCDVAQVIADKQCIKALNLLSLIATEYGLIK